MLDVKFVPDGQVPEIPLNSPSSHVHVTSTPLVLYVSDFVQLIVGFSLSIYTLTEHVLVIPALLVIVRFPVFIDVENVAETVDNLQPLTLSLHPTDIVLLPVLIQDVDAPVTCSQLGPVVSTYASTLQFVVFPALSFIVIVPTLVSVNVLLYDVCTHPLPLSIQATDIVLADELQDVDAPVTVPHVGGVLSTAFP